MPSKRSSKQRDKKQDKKQLNKIVDAIILVDGVRHGRPADIEDFYRKVRGRRVVDGRLRAVKRDVDKILNVTRSSRSLSNLRAVVKLLNFLLIPCFSLVFAGIIMIWYQQTPTYLRPILLFIFSPYFILPISILGIVFLVLRWISKQKLESIYDKVGVRMQEKKRLKSLVQDYIGLLGKRVKKYNLKPERFKFKLYHNDYKNVRYVGKPGVFSDFYVAVVETGEEK